MIVALRQDRVGGGMASEPVRRCISRPIGLVCAVLAGTLAMGASASAGPVLPTGGQVSAGSARIEGETGSTLAVSQTSSRAVIDWQDFSIGAGGRCGSTTGQGQR